MKNEEKEFEEIFNMSEAEIDKELIKLGYNPKKIEEESHLSKLAQKIISSMGARIKELESQLAKKFLQPDVSGSLPLEEMLNEFPDNRPLYHDSGSWQIRSDNMEDVLYQQATNESFYNFIKRCYEKENKLMDLGQ